ncbi:hypothetical protein A2397_06240 [Candidatus Amesbacteria bacterium RIFOXYB1_FULL_44_23]|uniref:General secretion pathway GspH domain-containing protein n=1 Tax=Candidatus Amesbacteria bacterium RIFOXYB1_FULL_44_23 TaxID=1797263 RepID=A0A1F4ZU20_9BACT|nr:MAG: hypothetical protein A2397_06240 [Candidatus Amesbacteria bacterium RIFOXYB1_FULL_44_23]
MKKQKAVTLIEVVLYCAVTAVMMGTLLPTALDMIQGGEKSMTMQEVASNGRNIMSLLKYKIRNASGVVSVSASTLVLSNYVGSNTTFTLTSGNVTIDEGAGAVNLNSSDTAVTALTFTDYTSSDGKTDNVGVLMTIEANFTASGRQEYSSSITLQTAAEVRGI